MILMDIARRVAKQFGKVIVNIHFRDWPEWSSKD